MLFAERIPELCTVFDKRTSCNCVSLNWLRNVEKFLQLGKEFGLEGGELLAFSKEQQSNELEKQQKEKDERLQRQSEEKEERLLLKRKGREGRDSQKRRRRKRREL